MGMEGEDEEGGEDDPGNEDEDADIYDTFQGIQVSDLTLTLTKTHNWYCPSPLFHLKRHRKTILWLPWIPQTS